MRWHRLIKGLLSVFGHLLSDLDILLEQSENENPADSSTQKICLLAGLLDMTDLCLVFKASSILSGNVGLNQGAEPLCSPTAILRSTEPVSGLTRSFSYCALNLFFPQILSVAISC